MKSEEVLIRLRQLKPHIFKKFKAKEIQLFGSYVRKEQNTESDIDLLVDFEEDADLFNLTGLAIFLEDEFQQKVDIVSKQALRSELKKSVLNESILI